MRKVIKKIVQPCIDFVHSVKWKLSYSQFKEKGIRRNYMKTVVCKSGDIILVVAPHADDELLSSYTVLARKDCEVWVYYCGFTGSNQDVRNREKRRQEIFSLCKKLGIPCVDGNGKKSCLENLLREKAFDKVIIPSLIDWHSEHRKVNYWLVNICEKLNICPEIYWYSVTVPMEGDFAVQCVPMTKQVQKEKYLLFKQIYHSQLFMPLLRFKLNERINGHYSGCYAAETFMVVSIEKLERLASKFQLKENGDSDLIRTVEGMKCLINDIMAIRRQSARIYKEVGNG